MSKISGIETHCAFDKSVDVVDLIPHPRNPNKHDDKQIALLAKIIRGQGWRNPIVVSERSGFIISGHGRLEAAKMLNVEKVPVDLQAFENEAEEYAHLIADNRIAELAETDQSELADLIRELDGEIDLDLTGFDEPSIAELMGESGPDGDEVDAEPQIDKADELRKKWNTALGQLWELGDHRLLCGDCTDEMVVDGFVEPDVGAVVTDPPYGMSAVSNSGVLKKRYKKDIEGDDSTDAAIQAFRLCRKLNVPQVWFGANYYCQELPPSGCWFVWDKNNGGSDQADAELAWTSLAGVVRVFTQASEKTGRTHPTQKHPRLIRWCIEKCGNASIVFDPFLGSGTTLMACENLGRKCRAIEIDPGYVAVALERWSEATGKTPKLTNGA